MACCCRTWEGLLDLFRREHTYTFIPMAGEYEGMDMDMHETNYYDIEEFMT